MPEMGGYGGYEVYQSLMGVNPQIPPQQTQPAVKQPVKKLRPNAIEIIDPNTKKNIMEDIINESAVAVSSSNSNTSSSGVSSGANTSSGTAEASSPPGPTQEVAIASPPHEESQQVQQESVVAGQQQQTQPQQQSQPPPAKLKPQHPPHMYDPNRDHHRQPPPTQQTHPASHPYSHPMEYIPSRASQPRDQQSQGREIIQVPPPQMGYDTSSGVFSHESQTPVVSANSDGPSVDITQTPKHVNKKKK
jgi:hypothetical protein